MTTLEIVLLWILYVINGAYCAYKTYNANVHSWASRDAFHAFLAFALNPIWLVVTMIQQTFFKQWY